MRDQLRSEDRDHEHDEPESPDDKLQRLYRKVVENKERKIRAMLDGCGQDTAWVSIGDVLSGRPIKEQDREPMRRVSVSIPESWYRTLKARAISDGRGVSSVVFFAVLKYLRLGCPVPASPVGPDHEPLPFPLTANINNPYSDF
jgi:hypothetical protein